jgi:hypothetical protein
MPGRPTLLYFLQAFERPLYPVDHALDRERRLELRSSVQSFDTSTSNGHGLTGFETTCSVRLC